MLRTFIGHRAHLGHAVMIPDASLRPKLLQPGSDGRKTASRFSSHNNGSQSKVLSVKPLLSRDLSQAQGISWGAAQNRALVIHQRLDAVSVVMPPPERQNIPRFWADSKASRTQEKDQRKRQRRLDPHSKPGGSINTIPSLQHGMPAFRRIQPPHGSPSRSTGLMATNIRRHRKGQIGAVGWMRLLVGNPFDLGRAGHPLAKGIE